MNSIKRALQYVKGLEKYVIASILLILIIQVLEFFSPLIVKSILDDCILGIEQQWVEVVNPDNKTVLYNDGINHYYKQEKFLDSDDVVIKDISIVIYKDGFYLVGEKVVNGTKEVIDGKLLIKYEGSIYTYDVVRLTKKEVVNFYRPIFIILIILVGLLFVRSVVSIIASYLQRLTTNKLITHIAKEGRTKAIKAVEKLPIEYFDQEPAGKMANRITSDVTGMIDLYRLIFNVFTNCILSFVLAYVGMFYLDVKLALISFVIYPLAYIWIRYFLSKLKVIAVKVNELRSMLVAKINEIINGISILQIFNYKKQTIKEFNKVNSDFVEEQLNEVKLHITFGWNMISIIRGIITVIIVVYFGWQRLNISEIVITAGLIYAYNEYLLKIIVPVNLIFTQVGVFQHALVQTQRIHKLIDGEQEDDTYYDIDRYEGNIEFKNVWFAYVEKEYVLKGIDISIKAGQTIGLVGHTGSGKSSLMNLLLRFYDLKPDEGQIFIDGKNITEYPKRTYRQHIGIVLQEPVLFKGTIATNIRFGKDDVTDEEIEKILISIGGERIIKKFEHGINQDISRAGSNMSCGEKQIIALARVLVHNPSVLIMDEATSHIDTETEQMIKQALNVVKQNRTTIIIAHRLSTILNADKIIVLDHGLKVEEGTHKELLELNKVYSDIYRAQVVSDGIYNE